MGFNDSPDINYTSETDSGVALLEKSISIPEITIGINLLSERGRLSEAGQQFFAQSAGSQIRRIGGGTSKEVFADIQNTRVFEIIQLTNPGVIEQSRIQTEFYLQHSQDPDFQELVVPISKVFNNQQGEVVAVEQPFYGISVEEYLQKGQTPEGYRVSKETIDPFIERYRKVINKTGFAHGDFIIGGRQENGRVTYLSDWGNVRIGPKGELKFIDYNGRGGKIAYNGNYLPDDKNYELVKNTDPERARFALYKMAGLAAHSSSAT